MVDLSTRGTNNSTIDLNTDASINVSRTTPSISIDPVSSSRTARPTLSEQTIPTDTADAYSDTNTSTESIQQTNDVDTTEAISTNINENSVTFANKISTKLNTEKTSVKITLSSSKQTTSAENTSEVSDSSTHTILATAINNSDTNQNNGQDINNKTVASTITGNLETTTSETITTFEMEKSNDFAATSKTTSTTRHSSGLIHRSTLPTVTPLPSSKENLQKTTETDIVSVWSTASTGKKKSEGEFNGTLTTTASDSSTKSNEMVNTDTDIPFTHFTTQEPIDSNNYSDLSTTLIKTETRDSKSISTPFPSVESSTVENASNTNMKPKTSNIAMSTSRNDLQSSDSLNSVNGYSSGSTVTKTGSTTANLMTDNDPHMSKSSSFFSTNAMTYTRSMPSTLTHSGESTRSNTILSTNEISTQNEYMLTETTDHQPVSKPSSQLSINEKTHSRLPITSTQKFYSTSKDSDNKAAYTSNNANNGDIFTKTSDSASTSSKFDKQSLISSSAPSNELSDITYIAADVSPTTLSSNMPSVFTTPITETSDTNDGIGTPLVTDVEIMHSTEKTMNLKTSSTVKEIAEQSTTSVKRDSQHNITDNSTTGFITSAIKIEDNFEIPNTSSTSTRKQTETTYFNSQSTFLERSTNLHSTKSSDNVESSVTNSGSGTPKVTTTEVKHYSGNPVHFYSSSTIKETIDESTTKSSLWNTKTSIQTHNADLLTAHNSFQTSMKTTPSRTEVTIGELTDNTHKTQTVGQVSEQTLPLRTETSVEPSSISADISIVHSLSTRESPVEQTDNIPTKQNSDHIQSMKTSTLNTETTSVRTQSASIKTVTSNTENSTQGHGDIHTTLSLDHFMTTPPPETETIVQTLSTEKQSTKSINNTSQSIIVNTLDTETARQTEDIQTTQNLKQTTIRPSNTSKTSIRSQTNTQTLVRSDQTSEQTSIAHAGISVEEQDASIRTTETLEHTSMETPSSFVQSSASSSSTDKQASQSLSRSTTKMPPIHTELSTRGKSGGMQTKSSSSSPTSTIMSQSYSDQSSEDQGNNMQTVQGLNSTSMMPKELNTETLNQEDFVTKTTQSSRKTSLKLSTPNTGALVGEQSSSLQTKSLNQTPTLGYLESSLRGQTTDIQTTHSSDRPLMTLTPHADTTEQDKNGDTPATQSREQTSSSTTTSTRDRSINSKSTQSSGQMSIKTSPTDSESSILEQSTSISTKGSRQKTITSNQETSFGGQTTDIYMTMSTNGASITSVSQPEKTERDQHDDIQTTHSLVLTSASTANGLKSTNLQSTQSFSQESTNTSPMGSGSSVREQSMQTTIKPIIITSNKILEQKADLTTMNSDGTSIITSSGTTEREQNAKTQITQSFVLTSAPTSKPANQQKSTNLPSTQSSGQVLIDTLPTGSESSVSEQKTSMPTNSYRQTTITSNPDTSFRGETTDIQMTTSSNRMSITSASHPETSGREQHDYTQTTQSLLQTSTSTLTPAKGQRSTNLHSTQISGQKSMNTSPKISLLSTHEQSTSTSTQSSRQTTMTSNPDISLRGETTDMQMTTSSNNASVSSISHPETTEREQSNRAQTTQFLVQTSVPNLTTIDQEKSTTLHSTQNSGQTSRKTSSLSSGPSVHEQSTSTPNTSSGRKTMTSNIESSIREQTANIQTTTSPHGVSVTSISRSDTTKREQDDNIQSTQSLKQTSESTSTTANLDWSTILISTEGLGQKSIKTSPMDTGSLTQEQSTIAPKNSSQAETMSNTIRGQTADIQTTTIINRASITSISQPDTTGLDQHDDIQTTQSLVLTSFTAVDRQGSTNLQSTQSYDQESKETSPMNSESSVQNQSHTTLMTYTGTSDQEQAADIQTTTNSERETNNREPSSEIPTNEFVKHTPALTSVTNDQDKSATFPSTKSSDRETEKTFVSSVQDQGTGKIAQQNSTQTTIMSKVETSHRGQITDIQTTTSSYGPSTTPTSPTETTEREQSADIQTTESWEHTSASSTVTIVHKSKTDLQSTQSLATESIKTSPLNTESSVQEPSSTLTFKNTDTSLRGQTIKTSPLNSESNVPGQFTITAIQGSSPTTKMQTTVSMFLEQTTEIQSSLESLTTPTIPAVRDQRSTASVEKIPTVSTNTAKSEQGVDSQTTHGLTNTSTNQSVSYTMTSDMFTRVISPESASQTSIKDSSTVDEVVDESTTVTQPTPITMQMSIETRSTVDEVEVESRTPAQSKPSASQTFLETRSTVGDIVDGSRSLTKSTLSTIQTSIETDSIVEEVENDSTTPAQSMPSASKTSFKTRSTVGGIVDESTTLTQSTSSDSQTSIKKQSTVDDIVVENTTHSLSTQPYVDKGRTSAESTESASKSSMETRSTADEIVDEKTTLSLSAQSVESKTPDQSTRSASQTSIDTRSTVGEIVDENSTLSLSTQSVVNESMAPELSTPSASQTSIDTRSTAKEVENESTTPALSTSGSSQTSLKTSSAIDEIVSESTTLALSTSGTSQMSITTSSTIDEIVSESTTPALSTSGTSQTSLKTSSTIDEIVSESTTLALSTSGTSQMSITTKSTVKENVDEGMTLAQSSTPSTSQTSIKTNTTIEESVDGGTTLDQSTPSASQTSLKTSPSASDTTVRKESKTVQTTRTFDQSTHVPTTTAFSTLARQQSTDMQVTSPLVQLSTHSILTKTKTSPVQDIPPSTTLMETSVITSTTLPTTTEDPCSIEDVCPLWSVCERLANGHMCTCVEGFITDENGLCNDVDECSENPCVMNAFCVNSVGSYSCECLQGYTELDNTCSDIDECQHDVCTMNSRCENTDGSYTCVCNEGYGMIGNICLDINECTTLEDVCPEHSECINRMPRYDCVCENGYEQDEDVCEDVDECHESGSCPDNSWCNNTDGSYTCTCYQGYRQIGLQCQDIDECNNDVCGENAECENTAGFYECHCFSGFMMTQPDVCTDVDECSDAVLPCGDLELCTNTHGSFTCSCVQGYQKHEEFGCVDTNECNNEPCPEHSDCVNDIGGFHCQCHSGYFKNETRCLESMIFEGSIHITQYEGVEVHLETLTSEELNNILQKVESGIYEELMKSSPNFYGLETDTVSAGSILVNITLYYSTETTHSSEELTNMFMSNLSFLGQYDLGVSYIVVQDVNECLSPDLNTCSNFAVCENLPGTYSCTCYPEYLDISVDKPGQVCALIDFNNQDPIEGIKLVSSQPAYPVGHLATMVVTMERGSHVTYSVTFDDGNSLIFEAKEILAFQYPIEITHRYDVAGNYSVTLTLTNAISSVTISSPVIIQDILSDIVLDLAYLDPVYQGNVMFTVSTNHAFSNVMFNWSFGDGSEQISHQTVFGDILNITHIYKVGLWHLHLNIYNMVSFINYTRMVISEEEISGVDVYVDQVLKTPGDFLTFVISTKTGSNLVLELDYGIGEIDVISKNNSKRGNSDTVILKECTLPGVMNTSVKLFNAIGEWTVIVDPVYIQYHVKDLALKLDPIIPSIPNVVEVKMTYPSFSSPPTAVTCEVLVNEQWENSEFIPELQKNNPLFISVVTDGNKYGPVSVSVNCSNMLSYQYIESNTYIQAVIEDVYISADRTSVSIGSTVEFIFHIGIGSHVEYTIWYGTGQNRTGSVQRMLILNETIEGSFTYGQPGKYDVAFFVRNSVTSLVIYETIWVLEEITGLTISRFYEQSSVHNLLHYGHGTSNDIFPVQRCVIFHCSVASGNNKRYQWDFGDGNITTVEEDTIHHKFISEGYYTVNVTVLNQMYSQSKYVVINMHEIVSPLNLLNNGPKKSYTLMEFTLKFTYSGTNSCFIWDMGDGTPLVGMGSEHCQNDSRVSSFIMVERSNTLSYSHMYTTEGLFTVNVTAFNEVSMATITSLAMISGISCYYPIVSFNGGRRTIEIPVKKLVSDWITLESTAIINCEVTNGPIYVWKIHKVIEGDTYLNHFLQPYDIDIATIDKLKVFFEPKTFDIGLYRISLNVSMVGIPGLYTEEFTYLNVEASPLVAMVKGGNARVVSFNKALTLDGLSDSYDPDSDVKSHLEFEWWCRLQDESFDDALHEDIVIIAAEDAANISLNGGGCFGTGIGRLPLKNGTLEISSLQLGPNSVNVFRLIVKHGITREATFEQVVHVVEGHPPDMNIKCVDNCRSKMNPSSEFSVQAVCESCLGWARIDYNWSLHLHEEDSSETKLQELDGLLLSDDNGAWLVFRPGELTGGRIYRLRLYMKVYGYTRSFTEYEFKTNLPPYGGNCSISPEHGFALNTLFEIQCQGWMNPGEEQYLGEGLLYRFWTKVRGGSDTQLLYYGPDPFAAPSKFPLGLQDYDYMHDIIVRISNTIGEYVETTLEAKVSSKPLQDLDDVRALASDDSSLLFTMKEAGQDQEFKQLIVAMASVLNTQPSDNDDSPSESFLQSTTSAESVLNIDEEPLDTTNEIDNEDKLKNTEMRSNIIHQLSDIDHVTLDALQQSALCFKVITNQRDELTDETQERTVQAITDMAEEFTKIIKPDRPQQTKHQVFQAAEEMLASVGNVMLAARSEAVIHLNELNIKDTKDDFADAEDIDNVAADTTIVDDVKDSANEDVEIFKAKELITKAFVVKDKIVESLVKTRTPGQELTLKTDAFLIHTLREEISKIDNAVLSADQGTFSLPSTDVLVSDKNISGQFVDLNIVEFSANPFLWSDSARFIDSAVVSLDLVDIEGHQIEVKNLSEPIVIDIKSNNVIKEEETVQVSYFDIDDLQHHVVKIRSDTSDMHIIVKPTELDIQLEVFVRYEAPPTTVDFDIVNVLPEELLDNVTDLSDEVIHEIKHTVIIPSSVVQAHGIGWWYIGIRKYGLNESSEEIFEDLSVYYDNVDPVPIATVNYNIQFITLGCYYWDVQEDTWSSSGCQISSLSNTQFTRCICNHLTSFGSEFFVPPNRISFDKVFFNMEENIKDNHAVLAMLCTVIVLYVVGVVWAWRKDIQDVQKWGVLPLCDNILTDGYFYEITVFTGLRRGAGTRSNISFVLAGDNADTGVRQLKDIKGVKLIDRGTINKFILSMDEPLGPLSYIRIWHDNSGVGIMQGWYLSKIVVRELQSQEKVYVFLCNRWLALEEDDGMVDRLLPVALHEDLTKFGNIFYSDTRKRFTDSHLWISVFSRPNKSTFTRVQRLSCIFSLLMTSMLASAMFYKAEENAENSTGYRLGPFKFTTHEIYISVITSLIVLPVNILIDQLFRRSKPKKVKKGQAFGFDRPLSTLSKFSVNFSNIFRSQTRTQVTPINDEDDAKGDNPAYRPDTVTSLSTLEPETAGQFPGTTGFLPDISETPAPMVFIKTTSNPPSPSFLDARHHHTPAPPLQLKVTRFKPEVLPLTSEKCHNESQPSLVDIATPSPTCSGCLTPNIPVSVDNSPNISPRFVAQSPTQSMFSFESSGEEIENITMEKDRSKGSRNKLSWKLMLPHWCIYVAWGLVFFTSSVSAAITFLYSLEWGKDKSIAWLTSMILTIMESVSLIQPTKIILLAMFVAVFLRKSEDEIEKEESEDGENGAYMDDIPSDIAVNNTRRRSLRIAPMDPKKLSSLREQRLKEIKMFRIIQEIAFYLFYLLMLILVASHNRDTNSYRVKESLMNVISPKNNISKVHDIEDLWHWMNHLVIPQLYTLHDWNNVTLLDNSRLIATQASYRVGPVRLRQHRVSQDICERPKEMLPYIKMCSYDWSEGFDDKSSYGDGWTSELVNNSVGFEMSPWAYRSTMDNDGVPYAGEIGVYSGGGYVVDLIGGLSHVTNMIENLQEHHWINKFTRILFVEFTIYNPNTNLFTTAQISFEMPTTRKFLSRTQIFTFRLFSYLGSLSIFVVLCELIALICVLYFVGLELKQIKRDGRRHFRSFWNCLQFLTLLTSLTCVIMYLLKHAMTSSAVDRVTKLKDKFYNFQRIAMWDDVFQTLLAFAIFASILKLIHILRFNRRMSMLAGTLKLAAREMTAFSIVFIIVLVAFVGSGYMLFGSSMQGFKSVFKGFETLLSFSLGSYDFHIIIEQYRVLGPVYFGLFFTFVMFVLINMFVTILNEAFAMVHKNVVNQKNEYEIVDFILGRLKNWIGVDFNKIMSDVKRKYLRGEQKTSTQKSAYTLEDLDGRLDQMMTSIDAICQGYLLLKDDVDRSPSPKISWFE